VIGTEVRQLLDGALRGERQLVPIGPLSFALRQHFPAEVNENSFDKVVRRIEELRAQQAPQQHMPADGEQPMPMPMPEPTTGAPPAQPALPENR